MLVHSVFFWLKPDLNEAQVAEFRAGLESLRGVPSVDALYIGTPAPTDRPVIDRSYSFALTVLMQGMPEHDAYQEHPVHRDFVKRFSTYWERVLIYDAA
jgi:hypothetical protein